MSADWLAAGPRGRKNPEPGQQNSLFVFSSSSSSPSPLLLLYSPASRSFFVLLYFCFPASTSSSLAVLLRKVSPGGSTRLRVLLLHFPAACSPRQFFISRLLVVSANSSFSGDRSILGAVLPNLTPPRIWPPPVKLGKPRLPDLTGGGQISRTSRISLWSFSLPGSPCRSLACSCSETGKESEVANTVGSSW